MSQRSLQKKILTGYTDQVGTEELLTLLLSRGIQDHTAVTMARSLLSSHANIASLSLASPHEYMKVSGIGKARAVRLTAAFQLGRRLLESKARKTDRIQNAQDVFHRIRPRLSGLLKEVFIVLALDTRNIVLEEIEVARGWLAGVEVHPREVFLPLLRGGAAAAIVVHNHPSGSSEPSEDDIVLTNRLRSVGDLVGIPVLDHVVIGDGNYVSLAERGY